jgi:L-Ala-D/L-Glu epimerase
MKVTTVELIPVSIPYRHKEISSRVDRGGVTDIVLRIGTDEGLVGWGECCSGADTASILAAAEAMKPFIVGRDPRDAALMRDAVFKTGLWDYRLSTGNFAYAGYDMALLDISAQSAGMPLWRFLGGRGSQRPVTYFYYLARGSEADLTNQCEQALARGYDCFYLKVGLDRQDDERMLEVVRATVGPSAKVRIDANEAWSAAEALKFLDRWDQRFDLDFVEAPVPAHPVRIMAEFKRATRARLCANEGLDGEKNVAEVIHLRAADVLCFSSYWVGTLRGFLSLSQMAARSGIEICKHSHGEFGIAATAHHHALLTLSNGVPGHQQTASVLMDDIVEPLPIVNNPLWGEPTGLGLGITIDPDKLSFYHHRYRDEGQFLPWSETYPARA